MTLVYSLFVVDHPVPIGLIQNEMNQTYFYTNFFKFTYIPCSRANNEAIHMYYSRGHKKFPYQY